jgi:hypothetical protein
LIAILAFAPSSGKADPPFLEQPIPTSAMIPIRNALATKHPILAQN